MSRHKWERKANAKLNTSGSITQCLKCECIREYTKGKPFYFLRDSVYHVAPKCVPKPNNP